MQQKGKKAGTQMTHLTIKLAANGGLFRYQFGPTSATSLLPTHRSAVGSHGVRLWTCRWCVSPVLQRGRLIPVFLKAAQIMSVLANYVQVRHAASHSGRNF